MSLSSSASGIIESNPDPPDSRPALTRGGNPWQTRINSEPVIADNIQYGCVQIRTTSYGTDGHQLFSNFSVGNTL